MDLSPVDVNPPQLLPEKRISRPTWKVRESASNDLPNNPGPLNTGGTDASEVQPIPLCKQPTSPIVRPRLTTPFRTTANQFTLVREYLQRPSVIPDSLVSWKSPVVKLPPTTPKKHREVLDIIYPYPNISSFLYNLTWRRMCGVASNSNREKMLNILHDKRFKLNDIQDINFSQIEKQITTNNQSPWGGNGWRRDSVIIEIPTGAKPTVASRRMEANERARRQRHDEVDPSADPYPRHKIPIPDVRTRSLVSCLVDTIQEDLGASDLHWHGYKETWQPPYLGSPPERVWGELYSSDAFLEAEQDLINSQTDASHPSVIAGYMIWSDSTHLAQFRQAKAWPIYAYIGNLSKYVRCQPTAHTAQVIGYIPPVCETRHDDDIHFIYFLSVTRLLC